MSAPPHTDERLVDLTWPGWLPLPHADGLVAVIPDQHARTAWADKVLGRDPGGFVVWAATGATPDRILALVIQRERVAAISLAPAGEDVRRLHVALRLAGRLASETAGRKPTARVPVTSASMPDTSSERIPVPHLVTLRDAGNLSEAVVWELLDPDAADRWRGIPLPDPALVEVHLAELLALRTATRTGRLPAGPVAFVGVAADPAIFAPVDRDGVPARGAVSWSERLWIGRCGGMSRALQPPRIAGAAAARAEISCRTGQPGGGA